MKAHLEVVLFFLKNLWFPAVLITAAVVLKAPPWLFGIVAGMMALGCFCKGYSTGVRELRELAALRRLAGLEPYPAETDESRQPNSEAVSTK